MLVLTGFEPYNNYEENPSLTLVHQLEKEEIKVVEVPASYRKAMDIAKEIIDMRPHAVLSFGFAPSRSEINVESLAINVIHASIPDNDGIIVERKKIYDDGMDCYFSTAPFYEIADAINSSGIKARVSFSAGTYVCNTLFYSLLYHAHKEKLDTKIGFIHIPPPENMAGKIKAKNYMRFESIKKAAEIAIEIISHRASP